jgi:prepilin-type N-terminal cleavage/methylation domain-containing protein
MDLKTPKSRLIGPISGRASLQEGFSLIELIVAISVSLFVTGIIIVNYNTYNTTQSLRQTALTLKNDLRFLESKAANGEKPGALCPTLTGWTVSFSGSSYSYQANCGGAPTGDATVVQLPNPLLFSPLPSPSTVTFKVLTRGTDLTTPLTVTLRSPERQYTVEISPSGDINDGGTH